MTASILVATPHPPFGELLRISLEDSGQYQVRLVLSAKEARAASGRVPFKLAIIDSSLTDEPYAALCAELLRQQPGLRLVVIPPENNPNHPSLGGLIPHGYLSRPFYLPDLLDTISRLLEARERERSQNGQPAESAPEADSSLPPWLIEPLTLTAYLNKEMASTQAIAGIVGLHDAANRAGTLRAWAGALNEEAAQELSGAVFRYWDRGEKTDLMRYLRLSSNKKEYLVYAAQITGSMALILAYDTAAPLSLIRPQTRQAAHTMAASPPDGRLTGEKPLPENGSHPAPQASPAPLASPAPPPAAQSAARTPASQEMRTVPHSLEERLAAVSAEQMPDMEDEDGGMEGELINLASLLGSIPPPDPAMDELAGKPSDWQPEPPHAWQPPAAVEPAKPEEQQAGRPAAEKPAAVFPVQVDEDTKILDKRAQPVDPEAETTRITVSAKPPAANPPNPLGLIDPPVDALEDTRPGVISTITQLTQLESTSSAMSLLNYTCVLVPRMPGHYLTGDLADRLSQWVAQLCLAFGWRLEGIAVRPEYLQWNVQVAPAVSPGNLVRILRQRTSQNIFQAFPTLAEDNPSGDFWASGYLIVSGPQPPSAQLLRDYITRTRRRQGIAK